MRQFNADDCLTRMHPHLISDTKRHFPLPPVSAAAVLTCSRTVSHHVQMAALHAGQVTMTASRHIRTPVRQYRHLV